MCLYEALGASKRAGDAATAAEAKMHLSRVFRKLGRFDESCATSTEAHDEFAQMGNTTFLSHTAIDISVLTRILGQLHDSSTFATRALAIAEETKHEINRLNAHISLARTESLLSGRFSESDSSALLATSRTINAAHQVALILEDMGDHLFLRGSHAEALAKYEESLAEIEKVAPRGEFAGELSWRIALCHVRLGNLERAHTWITRGLEHCTKSGDLKELALTLRTQGHYFLALGNHDMGFAKLEDALDRLTHLGVAFEAARTRLDLAKASRDFRRDRRTFDSHLDAAQAAFRTMGSNVGLDWIDAVREEPWPDSDDLTLTERQAVDESILDLDPSVIPEAAAASPDTDRKLSLGNLTLAISWKSPRFLEALDRLERFAPSTQPILIMGESGAGKTAFAEVAHRRGPGRNGPFIVLNCASLPESLVESELFGSTRGAFTGADRDRAGLIRAAANGTIFLDEIDKASRSFQATILHVLDRGEVRPVGGQAFHTVRTRFLFAANRDLSELASRGEFLSDLDYRISGLRVEVPPVRDRMPDFDLLLALALRELRVRERIVRRINRDARNLLTSYEWRGNVRELFSVVTAMAFLSDGKETMGVGEVERAFQDPRHIAHLVEARKSESLADQMAENEKKILLLTLRLEGGSQARAAGRLGITRRGLNKKLHRFGLIEQLERESLEEFSRRPVVDDDDDAEDEVA